MYNLSHWDNIIPAELHKEVYDYCLTQRWYTSYRRLPSLDIMPSDKGYLDDRTGIPIRKGLYRAPFASDYDTLAEHSPVIATLFDTINTLVLDGEYEMRGIAEKSQSIDLPATDDGGLRIDVPFMNPDMSKDVWKHDIVNEGARAYMQAQPYTSVRGPGAIHRDWNPALGIDTNVESCSTLIFVANLNWQPGWRSDITYYNDVPNEMKSTGWPEAVMPNVPGRIILHDGRQLHSTSSTGQTAPELSMHIGFRVSKKFK